MTQAPPGHESITETPFCQKCITQAHPGHKSIAETTPGQESNTFCPQTYHEDNVWSLIYRTSTSPFGRIYMYMYIYKYILAKITQNQSGTLQGSFRAPPELRRSSLRAPSVATVEGISIEPASRMGGTDLVTDMGKLCHRTTLSRSRQKLNVALPIVRRARMIKLAWATP